MMVAPVLIKAGIPNMAANMFILYFSVLSYVTPPVALSAYAAAGIARAMPGRLVGRPSVWHRLAIVFRQRIFSGPAVDRRSSEYPLGDNHRHVRGFCLGTGD